MSCHPVFGIGLAKLGALIMRYAAMDGLQTSGPGGVCFRIAYNRVLGENPARTNTKRHKEFVTSFLHRIDCLLVHQSDAFQPWHRAGFKVGRTARYRH